MVRGMLCSQTLEQHCISDGAPCEVKVSCTVQSGGKSGDNFKGLPIAIDSGASGSRANHEADRGADDDGSSVASGSSDAHGERIGSGGRDSDNLTLPEYIYATYNELMKNGWRMAEIDGMDILGFCGCALGTRTESSKKTRL